MKKTFLFILLLNSFLAYAQDVVITDFPGLKKEFSGESDTTKIINFWATWCKPCIQELPHFKEASQNLAGQNYKFIYVSLDFESNKERVRQMLDKKGMVGSFYLLTGDPNEWINEVDKSWQGDIPYTMVVMPEGKRKNASKSFESTEELLNFIK